MKITFFLFLFLFSFYSFGQKEIPNRPVILGIHKASFYVNNLDNIEKYYSNVLGLQKLKLDEELPLNKNIVTIRVNYRQKLEFIETEKFKPHLISFSLEVSDINQMMDYLNYYDIIYTGPQICDNYTSIKINRPNGIVLEFTEINEMKEDAKIIDPSKSLVNSIHHVGIYVSDLEVEDQFYKNILGFEETWRFNEDLRTMPNFVYLRMPDCVENIEYNKTNNPHSSHICFRVNDMQEFLYRLRLRTSKDENYKPIIGKGKRWLLNIKDTEGMRLEFTEPYVVK